MKINIGEEMPLPITTVNSILVGLNLKVEKTTPEDIIIDLLAYATHNGVLNKQDDVYNFSNEHLDIDGQRVIEYRINEKIINPIRNSITDDQQIYFRLNKIPTRYNEIVFVIGVFEYGETNHYPLSVVSNINLRIINEETKEIVVQNSPIKEGYFSQESVIIVGKLRRDDKGDWVYINTSEGLIASIPQVNSIFKGGE